MVSLNGKGKNQSLGKMKQLSDTNESITEGQRDLGSQGEVPPKYLAKDLCGCTHNDPV